jgi:transcriptional regulator with XRE-family HTH domain
MAEHGHTREVGNRLQIQVCTRERKERAMATPREQLAHTLRQARIDAGYGSHAKLAKALNVSRPVVSRAERPNEPVPSPGLLISWAKATGVDLATLNDYAERARSPRNWFAKWAEDFEQRATLIRCFEPLLVPGLVQTENYARAVLSWKPESRNTETNVAIRLERQSVLDRAELRVIILESVLNREVGNAEIMAEQIEHLLALGSRPSVTLQVLPDTPEIAGALGGAFAVATRDAVDVAVYSESIVKGGVYTDPDLIARAVRVFDSVHADALPWSQTRVVFEKAGEQWTQT